MRSSSGTATTTVVPSTAAAHVRGLAEGSTIVLSAASAALASECLPRGATLVDLGEHRLRGLAGLENLLAVRHADLPDPGLALRYLERRAAPPVPAALRLHGETPLVGHERELTSLRQAWTDAAGGRATLTLLAGEPGVGKTRLTAALAEHAAADGALVLCGRCDEEALQPYQPVAEAFGGALDRLSGSEVAAIVGDEAADLSLVLPELRARIPVRGEPTPERVVLFQAAAKLLARLAADRPVLIVLDDLHWADEPTLALLRHTLRTQSEATVMVVTTYRDTDLDASRSLLKWMVQLRREVTTVDIDVPGLERVDVSRLLGPEHADDLDTVWNMTDGNPFFVIELRRSLQEGTRSALPRSVRQSVSERVDRLPPVSREFVFAAAIAGVDVDVAVAARAARTATDAADDAVGHGILVEVPDEPNRLLFGHGLVRSAVLDGLSPDRRAGWHGRVAAAIEDVHIETIDEHTSRLAHHHRESGDERPDGPAYRWSMRAGRRAGRMLAYEEAEDQYREAAGIAGRGGDEARRITAELELAEILVRSGRPTTGHEIANAAAVAAAEIGASDLAGWAVFNTRFAQALGLPGNLDAIRAARSALSPDSPWRGPVDVVFAGELMQAGEVEAGIELLRTATDRAQLAGDWATLAFALTGSHTYIDRLDVPVDDILAAIAKADDNDAPSFRLSPEVLRVQSEGFRIGELIAEGNIRSARSAAREFAARYGGETGTVEVSVPLFSLVDAMLRGRWSEYQEQRDRFREDPELATGFESQLLCIDAMEAWLKGRLGDLVEVIEALPPTLMFVRPGLAIALAEARRPDDARCVIAESAANGGLEARSRTVFGRAELAMLALAAVGIGDVEAAARLRAARAPAWAGGGMGHVGDLGCRRRHARLSRPGLRPAGPGGGTSPGRAPASRRRGVANAVGRDRDRPRRRTARPGAPRRPPGRRSARGGRRCGRARTRARRRRAPSRRADTHR